MSDNNFRLADDSPDVHARKQFDLQREEQDGMALLEQERNRQQLLNEEDSEPQVSSSNQGSNRLNNGSNVLSSGIDPIKEEESNNQVSPPSQFVSSNQLPSSQQDQQFKASADDYDDDYEYEEEQKDKSPQEQRSDSLTQLQPPKLPPQVSADQLSSNKLNQDQQLPLVPEEDDRQEAAGHDANQMGDDDDDENDGEQQDGDNGEEDAQQEQYSLGGGDQVPDSTGQSSRHANQHSMMTGDHIVSSDSQPMNQDGDGEEGYIGEFSRDYINSEIFKLFDVDESGQITKEDLHEVAKQMGWEPKQMEELIFDMDPNHDGVITEEEFSVICRYISQRGNPSLPPIGGKSSTSRSGAKQNATATMHMYEQDKRKYGALLPKTGVYFLPDDKVLAFLRIMNQLRVNAERNGDYTRAKMMKLRFEEFSRAEQQRQEQNMRLAQEKELVNIESAQKLQFEEFSQAWDQYMRDYEATAFELIEQLKVKQEQELVLHEESVTKAFLLKQSDSKNLIEMRQQEKIFFSVKDYDKANAMRQMIKQQETYETDVMNENLEITLIREMDKLRQKHQQSLQTLLKRIQRDREEQVKHRQIDSKRLIQRNKNLLQDILEKQAMEQRRTQQFLKYALGKREQKSEEQLSKEIKEKTYNPTQDSFMPRLKRKIGHLTGEMSQMTSTSQRKGTFSARVSVYDNNMSINSIKKEKYTLVKNPLRTKMSTMSSGNASKSLLGGLYGHQQADPEQVLRDLKQQQKDKMEERRMMALDGVSKTKNTNSSLPKISNR